MAQVERENIDRLVHMLHEHEKRISRLEKFLPSESNIVSRVKKISIKEFILSKKPNDDVQKTLAIGYYLEKHEGLPCFNVKDIEKGYRDAKEKPPKNINDSVYKNIKKGYIMETKEKKDKLKAWTLTNTGEGFVENGFKKEG